ncbi:MAG: CDGSH iron-sulfur domain-containing protein [Phycisphaeraceae bacterium]|nr:CDGSH iron-sulfur domain-containing protein [Phycisphaeraceae bacterium]
MARLVRHDATGPQEVKPDPDGKSHWVCMCGLSQNLPFCDGSHKLCKQDGGEEEGKVYVYDKTRTKVERVEDDE